MVGDMDAAGEACPLLPRNAQACSLGAQGHHRERLLSEQRPELDFPMVTQDGAWTAEVRQGFSERSRLSRGLKGEQLTRQEGKDCLARTSLLHRRPHRLSPLAWLTEATQDLLPVCTVLGERPSLGGGLRPQGTALAHLPSQ